MPFLFGYVTPDQELELINELHQPKKYQLYSSQMQQPTLIKLDLTNEVGTVICVSVENCEKTDAYGAKKLGTLVRFPPE